MTSAPFGRRGQKVFMPFVNEVALEVVFSVRLWMENTLVVLSDKLINSIKVKHRALRLDELNIQLVERQHFERVLVSELLRQSALTTSWITMNKKYSLHEAITHKEMHLTAGASARAYCICWNTLSDLPWMSSRKSFDFKIVLLASSQPQVVLGLLI